MELTRKTVLESTPPRLNFPFPSVVVPFVGVPFTEIATPGTPSPFVSLTFPVIVFVCAMAVLEKMSQQTKIQRLFCQDFLFE